MKRLIFMIPLFLVLLPACLMTPNDNTEYSLFVLAVDNQSDDTLGIALGNDYTNFNSNGTLTYIVYPHDTVLLSQSVSTELDLSKDSKAAIESDLFQRFLTEKRYDTIRVIPFHYNPITWENKVVSVPADSLHSMLNVNSWKVVYNDIKGFNAMVFTFTNNDFQ